MVDDSDSVYQLKKTGKIIVSGQEVYYGCVTSFDEKTQLVTLMVKDWRDRRTDIMHKMMTVHSANMSIKYDEEVYPDE